MNKIKKHLIKEINNKLRGLDLELATLEFDCILEGLIPYLTNYLYGTTSQDTLLKFSLKKRRVLSKHRLTHTTGYLDIIYVDVSSPAQRFVQFTMDSSELNKEPFNRIIKIDYIWRKGSVRSKYKRKGGIMEPSQQELRQSGGPGAQIKRYFDKKIFFQDFEGNLKILFPRSGRERPAFVATLGGVNDSQSMNSNDFVWFDSTKSKFGILVEEGTIQQKLNFFIKKTNKVVLRNIEFSYIEDLQFEHDETVIKVINKKIHFYSITQRKIITITKEAHKEQHHLVVDPQKILFFPKSLKWKDKSFNLFTIKHELFESHNQTILGYSVSKDGRLIAKVQEGFRIHYYDLNFDKFIFCHQRLTSSLTALEAGSCQALGNYTIVGNSILRLFMDKKIDRIYCLVYEYDFRRKQMKPFIFHGQLCGLKWIDFECNVLTQGGGATGGQKYACYMAEFEDSPGVCSLFVVDFENQIFERVPFYQFPEKSRLRGFRYYRMDNAVLSASEAKVLAFDLMYQDFEKWFDLKDLVSKEPSKGSKTKSQGSGALTKKYSSGSFSRGLEFEFVVFDLKKNFLFKLKNEAKIHFVKKASKIRIQVEISGLSTKIKGWQFMDQNRILILFSQKEVLVYDLLDRQSHSCSLHTYSEDQCLKRSHRVVQSSRKSFVLLSDQLGEQNIRKFTFDRRSTHKELVMDGSFFYSNVKNPKHIHHFCGFLLEILPLSTNCFQIIKFPKDEAATMLEQSNLDVSFLSSTRSNRQKLTQSIISPTSESNYRTNLFSSRLATPRDKGTLVHQRSLLVQSMVPSDYLNDQKSCSKKNFDFRPEVIRIHFTQTEALNQIFMSIAVHNLISRISSLTNFFNFDYFFVEYYMNMSVALCLLDEPDMLKDYLERVRFYRVFKYDVKYDCVDFCMRFQGDLVVEGAQKSSGDRLVSGSFGFRKEAEKSISSTKKGNFWKREQSCKRRECLKVIKAYLESIEPSSGFKVVESFFGKLFGLIIFC